MHSSHEAFINAKRFLLSFFPFFYLFFSTFILILVFFGNLGFDIDDIWIPFCTLDSGSSSVFSV